MKSIAKALLVFSVFFLVYRFAFYKASPSFNLPKIAKLASFELRDQENRVFYSKSLEGKTWVVNFVFTRCQGPCPLITSKMAALQKEFSEEKTIHYVTLSMDADYDSPEIFKAFAKKHKADFSTWHFLTGNSDHIVDIARNIFKVPADKNPEMHTTRFVLIDSSGFIRGYYDSLDDKSVKFLQKSIKFLLSEF